MKEATLSREPDAILSIETSILERARKLTKGKGTLVKTRRNSPPDPCPWWFIACPRLSIYVWVRFSLKHTNHTSRSSSFSIHWPNHLSQYSESVLLGPSPLSYSVFSILLVNSSGPPPMMLQRCTSLTGRSTFLAIHLNGRIPSNLYSTRSMLVGSPCKTLRTV